ncbi:MAG: GIY-YIG nuclease family protein [Bacteroidia bacterium]|nr:GIY-YIG nuclease family protein [Bacteroidota bacterium]MBK8874255.1 GIY-YIG nuclease family protein [Bacteroidota bacterium]MBP9083235.1 GIY-YIG nuclease family protein [Bacteroidia bacterium]
MKGYTYILECCDGSFYTGSTKYLATRMEQHFSGNGPKYTRDRLPVKLVYFEVHQHIGIAFDREHQIKKWSRAKKIALINGEFNELIFLAMNTEKKTLLMQQLVELDELTHGSDLQFNLPALSTSSRA